MDRQITDLLEFLSSVTSISEIDLTLINHADVDYRLHRALRMSTIATCPAITSFRLHLTNFWLPFGGDKVLAPFINALRMPHIERLALFVDWCYEDRVAYFHPDKVSDQLQELIRSSLPDPVTHPHLKSFTVEIPFPDFSITNLSELPQGLDGRSTVTLKIPIEKIPQVSTLNATTHGQIYFFRAPKSDGSTIQPGSLRELRLYSCQNMDIGGLQHAIQSLKDVGSWDALDRVAIQGCDLLGFDTAAEVIGKERLCFTA